MRQNIASAPSPTAPTSDLIQARPATPPSAGRRKLYSAYVGAIVDLVRLMGSLHTAQYQYIPAIAFPQAEALNLRLNTPPSFHNPEIGPGHRSAKRSGSPASRRYSPPDAEPDRLSS